MNAIIIGDDVLERLREREPRYQEAAYFFVLSALHHVLSQLAHFRVTSGRDLAIGVRDLSIEKFGPMARTVLEHWGIDTTEDVGQIVFALVDFGILVKQEDDAIEDFRNVFDFEEAFEGRYPFGSRS